MFLLKETTWPDLQIHFTPIFNTAGRRERELLGVKSDE